MLALTWDHLSELNILPGRNVYRTWPDKISGVMHSRFKCRICHLFRASVHVSTFRATFMYEQFPEVMNMLWIRMLRDNKKNWRRVYKVCWPCTANSLQTDSMWNKGKDPCSRLMGPFWIMQEILLFYDSLTHLSYGLKAFWCLTFLTCWIVCSGPGKKKLPLDHFGSFTTVCTFKINTRIVICPALQSLLLLAHLIRNGSERVVTSAREHLYDLRSLESYHCVGKCFPPLF